MKIPIAALITTLILISIFGSGIAKMQDLNREIRPGSGVTAMRKLSVYLPSLAGSPGDTPIFILEGKEKGGTVFIAGGTHGNEIAGILAATVLVEHARVQKGRLIVMPHANNATAGYGDPGTPRPLAISIPTPRGIRQFRCGARLTNPAYQGTQDPVKYRHPNSREDMAGNEARNLDRAYPGKADGNLTEKIAFAIIQMLRKESVDIAIDLHESGPDSRLAWMVVANPKSVDLAAAAIINLDASGIPMKLERSSDTFRGLSHREWGDVTRAHAFLFETPNPGQGNKASKADAVNDPKYPLAKRAGVHLSLILAILDAYNETGTAGQAIKLLDVPGMQEVVAAGLGAFLR